MNRNIRTVSLMIALAVILAVGIAAQQKSADTAVDPVCGMTVVKANAKATFDYKGTTYYFCNPGCKDSFVKDPEKYLKAQAAAPAAQTGRMGGGMMMHQGQAAAPAAGAAAGCACQGGCKMMGQGGMMGQGMMKQRMGPMGMMHGGAGMPGAGMMAPGFGQLQRLYGDKIEVVVENTKDGAALKVTSKDPEVIKAIQVHMAEHIVMMKKMKEGQK